MANDKLGVFGNIQEIRRNKGFRSMYKGLGTTIFGILPYAGLKFFFFEYFRKKWNHFREKKQSGTLDNLVFGGLASCLAVSITYPTDVMRRKRQAQIIMSETMGLSYMDLVRKTFAKDGLKGFYKGLAVTYYKVIPSSALAFAINESLKKSIHRFAGNK